MRVFDKHARRYSVGVGKVLGSGYQSLEPCCEGLRSRSADEAPVRCLEETPERETTRDMPAGDDASTKRTFLLSASLLTLCCIYCCM